MCASVPVLSHNATVRLEDDSELEFACSTYEQLSSQPLKNNVCNERSYICTFREYLEICRDNKLICFIELKAKGVEHDTP